MHPIHKFHCLRGVSGIYQLLNRINGKSYIGQSLNLYRRLKEHRGRHSKSSISRAIKKYGIESFDFIVLEKCPPASLSRSEVVWVDRLKPAYNRTAGGDGCPGRKRTAFERWILSEKSKAWWSSLDHDSRRAIVNRLKENPRRDNQVSFATKQKISAALTGRLLTSQHSNRISAALRNSWRVKSRLPHCKPVAQLSAKGEVLWYYPSRKEAAEQVGIDVTGITGVINGKRPTAGGFIWKDFHVSAITTSV